MADILEGLAGAFREGVLRLKHSDTELLLKPAEGMDLRIRAEKLDRQGRLQLDIRWERAAPVEADPLEIRKA